MKSKELRGLLTPEAQTLMALKMMVDMFRKHGFPDGLTDNIEAVLKRTEEMNILDTFVEMCNDAPKDKDIVFDVLMSTETPSLMPDLKEDKMYH